MDQLQAMRVYRCIVEARGFSAAADRLGSSHSAVSRQLKALEASLKVQLLNRNTRGFTLTPAGERYYAACVDVIDRVDRIAPSLAGDAGHAAGTLRATVPHVIGALEAGQWLPSFLDRYPDIQLDLSCTDRKIDLVSEGFDVALRITPALADTTLMARTLLQTDVVLVASPGYLSRHAIARSPAQLSKHRLIAFSATRSAVTWTLTSARGETVDVEVDGPLRVDTIAAAHEAVLSGAGVAAFARPTVAPALASGRLVHLLPGWSAGRLGYFALYPQTRFVSPAVRAFVDHMAEHYRAS